MHGLACSRLLLTVGLLLTACSSTPPAQSVEQTQPATEHPTAAAATPTVSVLPQVALAATADLGDVRFSTVGWQTDFTQHAVPLSEISSGGPPRDGIPPIDQPRFVSAAEADSWLEAQEPVIHLAIGDDVRAYPLQILIWHEIVNDEVGGVPVAVTFCPLCNTAIAFDRRLDERTLDFGTTGNLRHSDLVMWDRQTESWWQQVTGEAIVGELTGSRLDMLPTTIVAWETFRQQFPAGTVLGRETGYDRDYGSNPYVGYDQVDTPPFLFEGVVDGQLPPKERVVTVSRNGDDVAYPFSMLSERRIVADTVGDEPIVVFFQPGTTSALDQSQIAASRDVGATGVFIPMIDGQELTFTWKDGAFVDTTTGSRWSILGEAVDGPLAGTQLPPVVHGNHFWFAWAAFKPDTRISPTQ